MHTPHKAGISGCKDGAYSIVMSGGYGDDDDKGEFMYVGGLCPLVHFILPVCRKYTGTGGLGEENRWGGGGGSWGSGIQTEDQSPDHKDNKALFVSRSFADCADLITVQVSCHRGKPVRVIRGFNLNSRHAPPEGFVVRNTVNGAVS